MVLPAGSRDLDSLSLTLALYQFFAEEAALLDAHDLGAWCRLLAEDFRYEIPIPITSEHIGSEKHSSEGFLAYETRTSIDLWVKRLSDPVVDSAYAENPPVRTRHMVTNVRVADVRELTVSVQSNVMLCWSRLADPPIVVTAERQDELALDDRGAPSKLKARRVLLDSQVVYLDHLRVIF